MSKVQLQGNVSGTGVFTIASPNSNTDRTQTLPDNSGTIVTTGSTGVITSSMLAAGVGGKLLQVVTAVYSTRQSFSVASSGTYYDTGLTASITPSSASNKILVLVTATHQSAYNGTTNAGSTLGLKRSATRIAGYVGAHVATISNAEQLAPTGNIVLLDSPASTSSVTYTVQVSSIGGGTTVWFNGTYATSGFDSYITLMEIAG